MVKKQVLFRLNEDMHNLFQEYCNKNSFSAQYVLETFVNDIVVQKRFARITMKMHQTLTYLLEYREKELLKMTKELVSNSWVFSNVDKTMALKFSLWLDEQGKYLIVPDGLHEISNGLLKCKEKEEQGSIICLHQIEARYAHFWWVRNEEVLVPFYEKIEAVLDKHLNKMLDLVDPENNQNDNRTKVLMNLNDVFKVEMLLNKRVFVESLMNASLQLKPEKLLKIDNVIADIFSDDLWINLKTWNYELYLALCNLFRNDNLYYNLLSEGVVKRAISTIKFQSKHTHYQIL